MTLLETDTQSHNGYKFCSIISKFGVMVNVVTDEGLGLFIQDHNIIIITTVESGSDKLFTKQYWKYTRPVTTYKL